MSNIGQGNSGLGVVTGGVAVDAYTPAMMEFDGSTGYYNKGTLTTTGNKVTAIASFECGTQAATAYVMYLTATYQRCAVLIDTAGKIFCVSANSANTVICRLITANSYDDGLRHTVMYSFDADTGVAILIVDGISDIDTGSGSYVAPTTGTLSTSASGSYNVGASNVPANYLNGQIGFCGHREAYLTNWSDFMEADGSPKALDESTWTEWGAQPLFWNEHGDMVNNLGSAGALTKNGTINVGKGGNYV